MGGLHYVSNACHIVYMNPRKNNVSTSFISHWGKHVTSGKNAYNFKLSLMHIVLYSLPRST
jgi:hypothetical protein